MRNIVDAFVPSVPCQLQVPTKDGVRQLNFRLTFDFYALSIAEEKLGVSMLTLNPKVWTDMSARTASILLWAGIQKFHSEDYDGDEGLAAIRSYLFAANVAPAIEAINEAYIAVQTEGVQKFIREAGERAARKLPLPNAPAAAVSPAAETPTAPPDEA